MKPCLPKTIFQVQITSKLECDMLINGKINEYITLGCLGSEKIIGRLVYRSLNYIHLSVPNFYVMMDIKTSIAYFIDFGEDYIGIENYE